jgi:membrane-bound ClpP family serine protease
MASRARGGLEPNELPLLDSPRAAEVWLETVGRATATGRLSHRDADAVTRAVREWLRAHAEGATSEKVAELAEKVAELSRSGLKVS